MWNFVTPQLPVKDLAKAQAWYRDVLGFDITWTWGEEFGAVCMGRTEVFLRREEPPWTPTWCCVRVDDADALYAIYRERGANIVERPDSKPWGIREFSLRDPNGHYFRIGHSTRR
jgi:uncharacterized glyoxalase superfamily protein PhnB